MNRYLPTTILLSFIILSSICLSCVESTERTDFDAPTVSDIRVKTQRDSSALKLQSDTIIVAPGDTIRFNRNPNATVDTLVMLRYMYLYARFTDNEALSSYKVTLAPDSSNLTASAVKDTAYTLKKGYTTIYNQTDAIVYQSIGTAIPDSLTGRAKYPVYEGLYNLKVGCMDAAGNLSDSIIKSVRLLRRETIIKNR